MSTNDTAATPLSELLAEARKHLAEHAFDYHHVSPPDLITRIDATLSAPAPVEPRDLTIGPKALAAIERMRGGIIGNAEAVRNVLAAAREDTEDEAPRPARPDAGEAVAWQWRQIGEPDTAWVLSYTEKPMLWLRDHNQEQRPLYAHPPAASAETARVAKLEQRLIQAVEAWGDGHDANRVYNARQSAVMEALNNLLDARAALGAQEVQS